MRRTSHSMHIEGLHSGLLLFAKTSALQTTHNNSVFDGIKDTRHVVGVNSAGVVNVQHGASESFLVEWFDVFNARVWVVTACIWDVSMIIYSGGGR